MKRLLLPILFVSAFLSKNAFATHAYRSEDCTSSTHNLFYKGNYPLGGMYGMTLVNQEEETSALPTEDVENNTLEDAEILFTEIATTITSVPVERTECYFDHTDWSSEKVIEISDITALGVNNLGLKKGDRITFTCKESTDFPNGNRCDDEN
ncbi:MAG: hypothetical protein K2Q18_07910 [Bdellovibrionales bacterium]|nr:hypothetical protein [Bdellovibrionales bacterium]